MAANIVPHFTKHMIDNILLINKVPIVSYGFLPTLAKHLWRVPKLICSHEDYIKSQNKTVCFDFEEGNSFITANASFKTGHLNNNSIMRLVGNIKNNKFNIVEYCNYMNKEKIYIDYALTVSINNDIYTVNHNFKYTNRDDYILNNFHLFLPGNIQNILKDTDNILEEHARFKGKTNQ
jgi:hypothetical protein